MHFLKRAWCGEERLWKVFWLGGVLASVVLQIIFIPLFVIVFMRQPLSVALVLFGGIAGLIVTITYTVWSAVAIWRCAFNCRRKVWSYAVRLIMVAALIGLGIVVASPGEKKDTTVGDPPSGWTESDPANMRVSPVEYKPNAAKLNP